MFTFTEVLLDDTDLKRNKLPLKRLRYAVEVTLNGHFFCLIEGGFLSDGSSIPRILRWKWESWGRYTNAALLHDWLLEKTDLPKWQVDWIFMGALRDCDVSALEAGVFWLAVRSKKSRN